MNEYEYQIPLFGPNYLNSWIVRIIRPNTGLEVGLQKWLNAYKYSSKRPGLNRVNISHPHIVQAGTNKLKCQFYLPTGSHLTQISTRVPNLDETLNLNNFGQNGQNWKNFVAIIKPVRWGFWGKKSFFDFDLFWPRSGQNHEPTLNFAPKYGTFAPFFNTPNFDTW